MVECYNIVFIPLMGNVNDVKAAFEVFKIANDKKLFIENVQAEIKQYPYVVAKIVAGDDEELLNKLWEIIKMNDDFLVRYENKLIDNARKVTQQVRQELKQEIKQQVTQQVNQELTEKVIKQATENVSKNIAKNLKNILSDAEISKYTGLSIEEVKTL